jgi:hypothetical protein
MISISEVIYSSCITKTNFKMPTVGDILWGIDKLLNQYTARMLTLEDSVGDVCLDDFDSMRYLLLRELLCAHVGKYVPTVMKYIQFCEAFFEYFCAPTRDEQAMLSRFSKDILNVEAHPFVRPCCDWTLPSGIWRMSPETSDWLVEQRDKYSTHSCFRDELIPIAVFFSLACRPSIRDWEIRHTPHTNWRN